MGMLVYKCAGDLNLDLPAYIARALTRRAITSVLSPHFILIYITILTRVNYSKQQVLLGIPRSIESRSSAISLSPNLSPTSFALSLLLLCLLKRLLLLLKEAQTFSLFSGIWILQPYRVCEDRRPMKEICYELDKH